MGKRVHEILERLYHHVARHGRPPSLAQVLERYRQDWERSWHDKIVIVRTENPRGVLPRARRALPRELLPRPLPVHERRDGRDRGAAAAAARRRRALQAASASSTGSCAAATACSRSTTTRPARYLPPQSQPRPRPPARAVPDRARADLPRRAEVELVWHYLIFNRTLRSRRSRRGARRSCAATTMRADRRDRGGAASTARSPGRCAAGATTRSICPEAPEAARSAAPARAELVARSRRPRREYGRSSSRCSGIDARAPMRAAMARLTVSLHGHVEPPRSRSSSARAASPTSRRSPRACGAGGGCGSCRPDLEEILADLRGAPLPESMPARESRAQRGRGAAPRRGGAVRQHRRAAAARRASSS